MLNLVTNPLATLVTLYSFAEERLKREEKGATAVEYVGPADLEVAWTIATEFEDQDFSLVDMTSFAVMQRIGVLRAASLDDDFAIYRFGRRRERAFELVR